jgi:uncharacterized membrane protein
MIEFFYKFFDKIGYIHPVHPPLTHIPMGLVIGVFVFALVALLFRRSILPSFAYRRIILLALIFAIPTAIFGYTDWQHFYDGVWLFPIKVKLVLTGVLMVLLIIAYILGRKRESETKGMLAIYTLCLLTVTILGYFGGQLIFEGEGRPENVPIRYLAGEKLFATNCSECHPHGSDILNAPQLVSFDTFLSFLHNPSGGMPSFPPDKISDQDAMKLYHYIIQLSGQRGKLGR